MSARPVIHLLALPDENEDHQNKYPKHILKDFLDKLDLKAENDEFHPGPDQIVILYFCFENALGKLSLSRVG